MTLFIDNYDSFSYILLDYIKQLGQNPIVFRNDEINWDWLSRHDPDSIVLSPGPCTPDDSGDLFQVINRYHTTTPILGICLGHQAIGQYFGAHLVKSSVPVHGIAHHVHYKGHAVFDGMDNPFTAMRYHSLILKDIPPTLEIICETSDQIIMGIAHKSLPLLGLQFHPESILTQNGLRLLRNWFDLISVAG